MLAQDSTHETGVAVLDKPSTDSGVVRARMRKANAALALKRDGYSWDRIASTLGYPTPRTALVAVEQALEEGLATDESQEFMRRMAGEQLQILLAGLMPKARDPHHPDQLAAVGKARELIMDHAKLMGYMAPQEVAIYTPMAAEIQEFIGTVIKEKQPKSLMQDNIFDDEPPIEMAQNDEGVFEEKREDIEV